jgi:hypothetical protein
MEEKIYCNICDEVIYVKDIENHITNSIHKKSKKEYLQRLSSVERDNKITNESTYSIWNSNTNSNVI